MRQNTRIEEIKLSNRPKIQTHIDRINNARILEIKNN